MFLYNLYAEWSWYGLWYKIILNLMEIMLPVLYLAYFKLYISTKEMLHVGAGDLLRILCYMLLYIGLFGVFCWTFYNNSRNQNNSLFSILGFIEAMLICVLPFVGIIHNPFFATVRSYILEYLHIYGIVVLLYGMQFVCLIKKRNSFT